MIKEDLKHNEFEFEKLAIIMIPAKKLKKCQCSLLFWVPSLNVIRYLSLNSSSSTFQAMPPLSPLAGKASVGMSGKENEQGDGGLFGYYNAALRCSPTSASSAIGGPRRGGGGFSALLGEARNEVLVERQINTMKADARVARELSHKERVAREQTLKEQHEKDEAAAQAVAKFYEEDERRQAHDVKVAARMLNEEKRQLQADAAVRKAREAEDAEHARRANEEEEINRQQWLKERDEEGAVVAKRVVQEVDDELLAERLIEQEKKDLAAARKAREAEDAEYARRANDKEEINRQRWLKERDEEGAEAAVQLAKVIDDELAAEEAAAKAKAEAEKLAAQEAEDAKEAGRLVSQ